MAIRPVSAPVVQRQSPSELADEVADRLADKSDVAAPSGLAAADAARRAYQPGQVQASRPVTASGPAATEKIPSLNAVFDAMPAIGAGPAAARVLSTNSDAWNARWSTIASATKTIDSQYFILE